MVVEQTNGGNYGDGTTNSTNTLKLLKQNVKKIATAHTRDSSKASFVIGSNGALYGTGSQDLIPYLGETLTEFTLILNKIK